MVLESFNLQDSLNYLIDLGVYDVLLPFLLVFSIVFATLEKTAILGKDKSNINAIVAVVTGLLLVVQRGIVDTINIFLPRISNLVHIIFFIGASIALYAFFIEPYWLEVRNVEITTDKVKTEFTVVQISDLHCDTKVRNEVKLVQLINQMAPDIIVFTGDAINTREATPLFKQVLSQLNARLGKVAVRGNWDVWFWSDEDLFGGTGFIELNGDKKVFTKTGEKIAVIGFSPEHQTKFPETMNNLSPGIYNILLYHYPGINEEIENAPIDLFLSGHTHGGQVALPFYGAIITLSKYGKKYEAGLYKLNNEKFLYVNRGIGMEGGIAPRVRFFARPEITIFHIKPKNSKENL